MTLSLAALLLIGILFSVIAYGIFIVLFVQFCILFFDLWARKRGAFYAPSRQHKIQQMLMLAGSLKGKRAVDLGSGDGRVMVALAKAGAKVTGYEINPLLVFISRCLLRLRGVHHQAHVTRQDFWTASLRNVDVVVIFGIGWIMKDLEQKLCAELKPGAVVISNVFAFPTWTPTRHARGVYLYEKH